MFQTESGTWHIWINHLLPYDDRDNIKELIDVMMNFFCIVSLVQDNIRELKERITRDDQ